MKSQAALLLILLTLSTSVSAENITVGGKEISIPAPEGYVRATKQMDAVYRISTNMADPMNDLLAYYIDEADVPAAMEGKLPPLVRTFMLKVNKNLKGMLIGAKDFAEIKNITKKQNKEIFESMKSVMPGLMDKSSEGISKEFDVNFAVNVSQMIPLEPHNETDNSLSYSMYISYGVSAEGVKSEYFTSATVAFVNVSGKVLFFYCYGPQNDLEWTRNASRAWTETVMASNAQPPEKSSGGRGINWDQVIRKGLIGAIIGGLAGVFMVIKRKMKI